jgi:hypothetical protein
METFNNQDLENIINNFDLEVINKIDIDNTLLIYNYLLENGIYYANDILLGYIDLFFYHYQTFKKKFNKLVKYLGNNYLDKLENDIGLFELMHQF